MKRQATTTKQATSAAVIAAGADDLYAMAEEILRAKPDTELNVLAGKLKTNMSTATQLRRRFNGSRTNGALGEQAKSDDSSNEDSAPSGRPATALGPTRAAVEARRKTAFKEPTVAPGDEEPRPYEPSDEAPDSRAVCLDDAGHDRHKIAGEPAAALAPLPAKPSGPLHKELKIDNFKFLRAERGAYGYQHKDGRAALWEPSDGDGAWTLASADGQRCGTGAQELKLALLQTGRKAVNKRAHAMRLQGAKAAELSAKRAAQKPTGPPAHVARAVEMLGGITLQRYDLDLLRGDKWYGKRMALLKKLFNRDRVLADETGIKKLTEAFHTAVGCADGKNAAERAKCFADRCKAIAASSRKAKAAAAREEAEVKALALRSTVLERTVPGDVKPAYVAPSKAERRAMDAAAMDDVFALAVTAEPLHAPRPDAEVVLTAGDVRLLEDPDNGIVMLQLERANSQGAIAVYNNGSRVAAGVVPPEVLARLRPILGTAELLDAAKQLLSPITPGVPVTHVAVRHLTAVTRCKEIIDMATKTSKKFEAPSKAAIKTAKSAKPATKKEPTERKSSLFRLKNDSKKTWEAFQTQKGEIVAAFVKLGAVGAKATGATRAQLIAALPKIDPKNISFYLSKWQPDVLEKLAPAE